MNNFTIAAEALLLTPFAGGMAWLAVGAIVAVAKRERQIREAVEANLDRADELTETCGMADGDTFCRRPWDHADDFHADGFGRRWPVERAA